jgi:hypothetical protein
MMCVVAGSADYLFTLRDVKKAIHRTLGLHPRQQRLFGCSMELQQLFGPSELRNSDLVNDIIDEDNTVDLQMVLLLPEQIEEEEQKLRIPSSCSAELRNQVSDHVGGVTCP